MATVKQLSELKFKRDGRVMYRGILCGVIRPDYAPTGFTFWHEFGNIGHMPKCFNINQVAGRTLAELKQKLRVSFEEWIDNQ